MYHIKADRRANTSTERISQAYIELLKAKDYRDITISDIQHISGVSRSTIYRLFDTPDDIIKLLCDRGFEDIFKNKNGLLISVNCFNYWFDHSEILEMLIKIGQMDYFSQVFAKYIIESGIMQRQVKSEEECHYFAYMLSYAMAGFLSAWISRGRKESKSELFHYVVHSLKALKPAMLVSIVSSKNE